MLEFCGAGGQVTNRQWVPLGTKDFASVIAALPDDVDAIYLGLGGADAVNFLNQYQQAGGKAHLMGGSIMIDQTILSSKGSVKNALVGTIAASGQADTWDDPGWQKFVKAYQDAFPPNKRFPSPSLLATNYYGSTMALILALRQVNGDLGDNQAKLNDALANIEIDAPNGKIKLDANRQAIGTNFVTEVVDDGEGALFSKVVKVIPNVNQTLGYDRRRQRGRSRDDPGGGSVIWVLQGPNPRQTAPDELTSTGHPEVAGGLSNLPRDNANVPNDVPPLGPPRRGRWLPIRMSKASDQALQCVVIFLF
jgi:hypothetical protein